MEYSDTMNNMGTGSFRLSSPLKKGEAEREMPEEVGDIPLAPLIRELTPFMGRDAVQALITRVSQGGEGVEKPEAEDMQRPSASRSIPSPSSSGAGPSRSWQSPSRWSNTRST